MGDELTVAGKATGQTCICMRLPGRPENMCEDIFVCMCRERRLVTSLSLFVAAVKLHLGSGVCPRVLKAWASEEMRLFLFGGTHTHKLSSVALPKFTLLAKCQLATIFGHKLTRSNLLWKNLSAPYLC